MSKMLAIHNLSIQNEANEYLIKNLNLTLNKGQVNVLIGESGSGKSLTAKAMVRQLAPSLSVSNYEIVIGGKRVVDMKSMLGSTVGFIAQDYSHSFNDHTKLGKQLMAIYRAHYQVSRKVAKQIVTQALESVGLGEVAVFESYRFNLSGGQLARVQIASVLMLRPDIIIADEPTSSLDVVNAYEIMNLIRHLTEVHETTLLLITHDLSHVVKFSDWIAVIKEGEIVDYNHVTHFNENKVSPYSLSLFNARRQLRKEVDR
ncbi:ABC transporter ATP-binding protein [Staphylococcus gallinarum]|uniref:ABC transporter ATP-binding protein n=1 Tax=Staphylococcus gallinarum TaxID=1293 RepID=A0A3A0VNX2_STAGA|nr:ATP-binding cassette domain-containing protein [Staphylococcus gallinarum]RIP37143.1 ABC transporter ATP-binding protein [Staphylococcus gallinarum]